MSKSLQNQSVRSGLHPKWIKRKGRSYVTHLQCQISIISHSSRCFAVKTQNKEIDGAHQIALRILFNDYTSRFDELQAGTYGWQELIQGKI